MLSSSILIQLVWSGLAVASFNCLFAVAFALVLKVNHLWNFAQAAMMVVAYATALACTRVAGLPIVAALVPTVAVTVGFGICIEAFGFATLRRRGSSMLAFFIFALVLSELVIFIGELVIGTEPTTLLDALVTPVHLIGGVAVSDWDLAALVVTSVMLLALAAYLRWSRRGQHLLAVADNPALAELYGIGRDASFRLAIALAAVFIAVGMLLLGTKAATVPATTLQQFLIISVVATVLAGIGRVFAAGIAALLLGVLQGLSILVISARWQPLLIDALMLAAVILFPHGVVAGVARLVPARRVARG